MTLHSLIMLIIVHFLSIMMKKEKYERDVLRLHEECFEARGSVMGLNGGGGG